MNKNSKIYIAGHTGMVGSAITRKLTRDGFSNLLYRDLSELDLLDQQATADFFKKQQPEYVFLAAARVGGILANNTYRAQFIYENLQIQNNVIHSAYQQGVKKLLFLGSSCLYPKEAPQPIREEYLLSGPLENTNEPYAVAKIAGIKMCQAYNQQYGCNFIAVMPTNLYGPNDNFDLQTSHVLAALIRKFHEAKKNKDRQVAIWGSGTPRREFLHVDDLAAACLFLMENYNDNQIINVGTGLDVSISDLASLIKDITGYEGAIEYDKTKPDGTPRKLLDIEKIKNLGWKPALSLQQGIGITYAWYIQNEHMAKHLKM